jgi:hypothetical protein
MNYSRLLSSCMRRSHGTLLALALGCATSAAFGQSDVIKPGEERFTIGLGWVFNSFGTDLRVDNQASQGSNVNLKDDLGAEQKASSYWASAEWRFAPRHRIGFSSSVFTLKGTKVLSRNIQIGDELYPAGATVASELKVKIIPITYSYSFIKSDRNELAATIGLHWSSLKFQSQGSASLDGQDANADITARINAPLPLIGLRYDHHFSQRWSAGLQGGVFALKFGKDTTNAEGDIWSATVYAEYLFSRHFALGLNIEAFSVDVDASSSSWKGAIDYGYWGPQLYLKARF